MSERAGVGVFGATGYTGRELVRLLRQHPHARIAFTTGSDAGHLDHEIPISEKALNYIACTRDFLLRLDEPLTPKAK